MARVEEHVLLGERVLGVARRLDVEVGDARVLHGIVLRVRLVQVVVRVLAGVIAHAAAYGHARDLKGRRLFPIALSRSRLHVPRGDQGNRLVQPVYLAQTDRLRGRAVNRIRHLPAAAAATIRQFVRFSVHIICHYYGNLTYERHEPTSSRSVSHRDLFSEMSLRLLRDLRYRSVR